MRISFFGGGTDLPSFYKHSYGSVLSAAINKHVYVVSGRKFDGEVRVSYSETENVETVSQIRHDIIRESLRLFHHKRGIEVVTVADVPGQGTGLGSSSALAVGLIHTLLKGGGERCSPRKLAELACKLEIGTLRKKIGRQDQYAVAFGGLNKIVFQPGDKVEVNRLRCTKNVLKELQESLICFYIPRKTSTSAIMNQVDAGIRRGSTAWNALVEMRFQADEGEQDLETGDLEGFAKRLHRAWQLKKRMSDQVSNPEIDSYYETAISAGAMGGKISGAGGGGFLTLFCEKRKQERVKNVLRNLIPLVFDFNFEGSEIIYDGGFN